MNASNLCKISIFAILAVASEALAESGQYTFESDCWLYANARKSASRIESTDRLYNPCEKIGTNRGWLPRRVDWEQWTCTYDRFWNRWFAEIQYTAWRENAVWSRMSVKEWESIPPSTTRYCASRARVATERIEYKPGYYKKDPADPSKTLLGETVYWTAIETPTTAEYCKTYGIPGYWTKTGQLVFYQYNDKDKTVKVVDRSDLNGQVGAIE